MLPAIFSETEGERTCRLPYEYLHLSFPDAIGSRDTQGGILNLAFRVNLHTIDAFRTIKGTIRAVYNVEATDNSAPEIIRHGIEFQSLQPNDMIILQSRIYQQIVESPNQLV